MKDYIRKISYETSLTYLGDHGQVHTSTGTYAITTRTGPIKALEIFTNYGHASVNHENSDAYWVHIEIVYGGEPRSRFDADAESNNAGSYSNVSTRGFISLMNQLVKDLDLPVATSPKIAKLEGVRRASQSKVASRLAKERAKEEAKHAAHKEATPGTHTAYHKYREETPCSAFKKWETKAELAEDAADLAPTHLKLAEDTDKAQKKRTVARLIKVLFPFDLRMELVQAGDDDDQDELSDADAPETLRGNLDQNTCGRAPLLLSDVRYLILQFTSAPTSTSPCKLGGGLKFPSV